MVYDSNLINGLYDFCLTTLGMSLSEADSVIHDWIHSSVDCYIEGISCSWRAYDSQQSSDSNSQD